MAGDARKHSEEQLVLVDLVALAAGVNDAEAGLAQA